MINKNFAHLTLVVPTSFPVWNFYTPNNEYHRLVLPSMGTVVPRTAYMAVQPGGIEIILDFSFEGKDFQISCVVPSTALYAAVHYGSSKLSEVFTNHLQNLAWVSV